MTYVFIETSRYIGGAFWIFFNNKVFVGAIFLAGQHAIFFWVECIFLKKKSHISMFDLVLTFWREYFDYEGKL